MTSDQREIWFRCSACGFETYCDAEIERSPVPDVMCPKCHTVMLLPDVRLAG